MMFFLFVMAYLFGCVIASDPINSDQVMQYEAIHRIRRAAQTFVEGNVSYTCDTNILPQPTAQYPAVLFKDINYNNCSSSSDFMRIRAGVFEKWGENTPGPNQRREFKWRSMLMLPGINITFRACCPSGNNFVKVISNWHDTADIHLSIFDYPSLKDNRGIWYENWLHWVMSFYLRLDHPVETSSIDDCGECYFGECGLTKKCECADGYSGANCTTRPTNDTYPNEKKPLILFKEKNFQGNYTTVNPEDFQKFAYNIRGQRYVEYNSMRVLHNRTVTFARNIIYTSKFTPGNDIRDITEFMTANSNVADGVWFNYDHSIDVDFYVRVDATPQCYNCSYTNGVCYTGSCVCINNASGENCDEFV